ncbi:hypothetical protein PSTT_07370 [Puccinia striiformis]|uniref:Uncharacterized protein n=1 Tax=Puccinia striiformis TaxID=27350 RepID=A0A2S4VGL2_9BASI|nr:hypothetical protein PSTT_07370 [Puccinia striiformis]
MTILPCCQLPHQASTQHHATTRNNWATTRNPLSIATPQTACRLHTSNSDGLCESLQENMKEKPASSLSQTPTRIRPTKNTPKVPKIKTPTKKRTTTKKEKIRKEESEEEDVDQEAIPWYNLAEELFLDGTYATGATALNDPDEPNNTSSELSGLSKNSVKRRKIAAKAIDLDSSDDDKVEVVKKPAREPPKKRVRENKYDVLKSGVDSIVEALRGDKGQSDIKPNIKPPVATEPNPAPASNPRQEAIKLIASMFFGVVSITEYISFIRVVETEADAEVFISLASTTDSTVCKAWFLMATNPHLFFFLVKFNRAPITSLTKEDHKLQNGINTQILQLQDDKRRLQDEKTNLAIELQGLRSQFQLNQFCPKWQYGSHQFHRSQPNGMFQGPGMGGPGFMNMDSTQMANISCPNNAFYAPGRGSAVASRPGPLDD